MSKVAMVTGAGTGVGRRVSEVLSKEDFIVYLIGRRKDKLIETQELCPGKTEVVPCDVSDQIAVENVFKIIEEKKAASERQFWENECGEKIART